MGMGPDGAGGVLRVFTARRDFPRNFLFLAADFFDFFAGIVLLLSIGAYLAPSSFPKNTRVRLRGDFFLDATSRCKDTTLALLRGVANVGAALSRPHSSSSLVAPCPYVPKIRPRSTAPPFT